VVDLRPRRAADTDLYPSPGWRLPQRPDPSRPRPPATGPASWSAPRGRHRGGRDGRPDASQGLHL